MPTNVNLKNPFVKCILSSLQYYNHVKYWKRREICTGVRDCKSILRRALCLFYVKRCDAFNNASTGADLGRGATFKSFPKLPHGLNGIIINPYSVIGENCVIYQLVTL